MSARQCQTDDAIELPRIGNGFDVLVQLVEEELWSFNKLSLMKRIDDGDVDTV